jgi:hypothetical protein
MSPGLRGASGGGTASAGGLTQQARGPDGASPGFGAGRGRAAPAPMNL